MKPIGVIHTPYRGVTEGVPIQGRLSPLTAGTVEIYAEYREAMKDLNGFSHTILIYYFHESTSEKLTVTPYMDSEPRGTFATRSPHRPNHIGITLVELLSVRDGTLEVRGVDMIDGTPLLDIKPYNPVFDTPGPDAPLRTGWMSPYITGTLKPRTLHTGSLNEWLHEEKNNE
jgi:tRNA-Thr(GGU) m(6)t(6)A37 methyltransferase TsaA